MIQIILLTLMKNFSLIYCTIVLLLLLCYSLLKNASGTSVLFQWLRLHAPTAVGLGSIPGQGTKIPHAVWCGQKNKMIEHLCEQGSPLIKQNYFKNALKLIMVMGAPALYILKMIELYILNG